MVMVAKDLIYLNDAATSVYKCHIQGKDFIKQHKPVNSVLTEKEVEIARCLWTYGASQAKLGRFFNVSQRTIFCCVNFKSFRHFVCSYQMKRVKKLGYIYFEYNKYELEKFYNSLPNELKSLSVGVIVEERLVVKSRLCKQDC